MDADFSNRGELVTLPQWKTPSLREPHCKVEEIGGLERVLRERA
jgi:hypothetical protein